MDNSNIILKTLISAFAVILISSSVLALGISTPYYPSNPLKMYPGETREVSFTLVNGINEKTTKAFVNLEESAKIAELISPREYNVEPGSKDNKVTLKISIPKLAKIGASYDVRFSISSSQIQKGNTLEMGVGYIVSFPVKVVNKTEATLPIPTPTPQAPAEKEINALVLIIGIVVIIAILAVIFLISKKKK